MHGCWSLAVVVLVSAPATAGDDMVTVTVTGKGLSEDAACRDALRKALERGAGNEISSRSQVENSVLIRDAIYARADGIVSEHTVLETGDQAGGIKFCRIRAKVSQSAIASSWGEVQNVLAQVGQPGVMVYIRERVDEVDQDSSIAESQIEKRFLEAGFDVHARAQMDAIARKELNDAVETGNVNKAQKIAKQFATEIFITGTSDANAAGSRLLAGERVAMYNADGVIKMYYTDTGQLLASQPLTNCRGGVRTSYATARQGGKKAMQNCAEQLAESCYWTVMKFWATRISAGGLLILEVEGINFADAVKLEKKLETIDLDKIGDVTRSFTKGTARYTIKARMAAADLAEHLIQEDWASLIQITEQQTNRIQARWIGN